MPYAPEIVRYKGKVIKKEEFIKLTIALVIHLQLHSHENCFQTNFD